MVRSEATPRAGPVAWLALVWLSPAGAADCVATPERHAVPLGPARIAAPEPFHAPVGPGWTFALEPQPFGWSVAVYDRQPLGDAVDMAMVTPPFHGPANPRDISGWHFRNAANTGPNEGDVNAPQQLRNFLFSRALAGTGGFRAPADPDAPRFDPPDTGDGRGWLRIIDFRLADLEPGRQARMTELEFEGCLSWPRDPCEPDPARYAPDAALQPGQLTGDFDGDGTPDRAALVRRLADGARGLAVCLNGSRLEMAGLDADPGALEPGFIDRMEAWRVVPPDHGPLGYVGEPPWPAADGDILVLERLEKQIILLYVAAGRLRSQQVYRYVEL